MHLISRGEAKAFKLLFWVDVQDPFKHHSKCLFRHTRVKRMTTKIFFPPWWPQKFIPCVWLVSADDCSRESSLPFRKGLQSLTTESSFLSPYRQHVLLYKTTNQDSVGHVGQCIHWCLNYSTSLKRMYLCRDLSQLCDCFSVRSCVFIYYYIQVFSECFIPLKCKWMKMNVNEWWNSYN